MFETLSDKFESFFKKLKGHGKLSEKNISEVSQKLRMTLLEADVNFKVAKYFVTEIEKEAIGQKVHESLTPAQHYIKIVHAKLIDLLGKDVATLNFRVTPPLVILVCGLQGSGKTTTCGKLAKLLKEKYDRNPFLVPADVYRPAAKDQLKTVARHVGVECFDSSEMQDAVEICKKALSVAQTQGRDTVILDTAGRLHIDESLMQELKEIKSNLETHETLLVADAMTGQEAVRIAGAFHEALQLTGLILSKMDGDARGGAALSMKHVTQVPIKFIGMGEKMEALETFYPDRMCNRILQMGDMMTLIEKSQEVFDEAAAQKLEKKIRKNEFTLEDFRDQMKQMQKMGSVSDILKMIPGAGKLTRAMDSGVNMDKELKKSQAIIDSMTPKERRNVEILNGSRRLRIARGSGTQVQDVNRFMKQFTQAKKMMKKMSTFGNKLPLRNIFQ